MTTENVGNVGEGAGSEWSTYIGPFATAVGKGADVVTEALKPLVGEPGQPAIEVLSSDEFSSFEDIAEALNGLGIAKGILKKAVSEHLRQSAPQADSGSSPVLTTGRETMMSFDVLPSIPDDEAWLNALKTGGKLKVDTNVVIAGMRAALAARSGLYELPSRLATLMESHADNLAEPVGSEYFELTDLLTKRNYSEIFTALGIDGRKYATVRRKEELVNRLDNQLWPALLGFQSQLRGWVETWQQAFINPSATMGLLAAAVSGRGGALPPGMTEAPPTDGLHDAAETVINEINRCFAGLGIPAAMAMAYDAQCIKKVLENPNLPVHVGASNRDQMLKLLRVDVAPDYVRLERNVSRYLLAVMELPKVTADAELTYLQSMMQLGSQIPWDKLGVPQRKPTLPGRKSARTEESDSDDNSWGRRG